MSWCTLVTLVLLLFWLLGILIIVSIPLRKYLPKWYVCDLMAWHYVSNNDGTFDGASVHNKCEKCGKEVMQDSQGDWF